MTTSTSPDASLLERYLDPDALKKDLTINLTNVSESLANQTQLFVHYASLAVRARRQSDRWKAALEVLEARLDNQYRKSLKEENPKVTEGAIRAAVVTDSTWKATNVRVIDAQEIYKLCDVAERAFEHRREMVKQIAQDQARESEGSLRVMHNQDAAGARDRLLERMAANTGAAASAA